MASNYLNDGEKTDAAHICPRSLWIRDRITWGSIVEALGLRLEGSSYDVIIVQEEMPVNVEILNLILVVYVVKKNKV